MISISHVQLALNTFRGQIMGKSVVLMSDNATVVAYIKKRALFLG